MRRFTKLLAGTALLTSILGAPTANAASALQNNDTTPTPTSPIPVIVALDCGGTTGTHGCGAGWFWRDGWRGWGCYPC